MFSRTLSSELRPKKRDSDQRELLETTSKEKSRIRAMFCCEEVSSVYCLSLAKEISQRYTKSEGCLIQQSKRNHPVGFLSSLLPVLV
jgi:hypothetical protein